MTNGEKIRALRKKAGIKGVELAEMLGVTRSYISQIENGLSSASDDLLNKVKEMLNISDDAEPSLPCAETSNFSKSLAQEVVEIKQRLSAIETLLIQVLAKLNK
jgi:transcriptional regulator with XRE-family HTH domain